MSPLELKSRHRDRGGKTTPNPQQDQESLRLQHQLVTEQLKGLFRQREQNLQQVRLKKMPPGGPHDQSSVASRSTQGMMTATEGQPASLNIHCTKGETQSIQEQLKEKTQIISTMASEIQGLRQKNESLMKAKLRFQQQIQDIRRLSTQQPERTTTELAVPRLPGLGAGAPGTQGSNCSLPSPQSDESALSSSPGQEKLRPALQEPELPTDAEKNQRGSPPDTFSTVVPALPLQSEPGLPAPTVPSIKLSPRTGTSLQDPESEGDLLSLLDTALLSPRPFGSPRPWSPFKFQGSPEPTED